MSDSVMLSEGHPAYRGGTENGKMGEPELFQRGQGRSGRGRAQQEGTWSEGDGEHGRQYAKSGKDNNNHAIKCLLCTGLL